MEKIVNQKKQMVKIHFGFYGGKNYGADYDAIKRYFNLTELMPYYSDNSEEFKELIGYSYIITKCCPEIPKDKFSCAAKLPIYVNFRYMPYDNCFDCCFKIGE